jgi:hypothetical protein
MTWPNVEPPVPFAIWGPVGTRWGPSGDQGTGETCEIWGRGDGFRPLWLLFSQVARTPHYWGSRGRRFESGQPDQQGCPSHMRSMQVRRTSC